ncbi:MAG: nicotinate (nicotinamide) nucleotide adenylyltransferase [Gammaproteobacteria bacterium]|nr:nicotinate (nicotinamide) nucleotide adenylyltransferase [Gammaproteobacteria bacterium]
MKSYAFFGGAFDPIHLGHLKSLVEIQKRIGFTKIFVLPYNISPTGKTPVATADQRLAMASTAIDSLISSNDADERSSLYSSLGIEKLDLQRVAPAYTYNSLQELRRFYDDEQGEECHISFIMGDDCYASLHLWHKWDALCEIANLLVINRDNISPAPQVLAHENMRLIMDLADSTMRESFLRQSKGCIAKLELPLVKVSSSKVRNLLAANEDLSGLVMPTVINYINKNKLYA